MCGCVHFANKMGSFWNPQKSIGGLKLGSGPGQVLCLPAGECVMYMNVLTKIEEEKCVCIVGFSLQYINLVTSKKKQNIKWNLKGRE